MKANNYESRHRWFFDKNILFCLKMLLKNGEYNTNTETTRIINLLKVYCDGLEFYRIVCNICNLWYFIYRLMNKICLCGMARVR